MCGKVNTRKIFTYVGCAGKRLPLKYASYISFQFCVPCDLTQFVLQLGCDKCSISVTCFYMQERTKCNIHKFCCSSQNLIKRQVILEQPGCFIDLYFRLTIWSLEYLYHTNYFSSYFSIKPPLGL